MYGGWLGISCATNKNTNSTSLSFNCPSNGDTIQQIMFSSYGQPSQTCTPATLNNTCHALNSTQVVENFCLGKSNCSISMNNGWFGDPCSGKTKWLTVQYRCASSGLKLRKHFDEMTSEKDISLKFLDKIFDFRAREESGLLTVFQKMNRLLNSSLQSCA